MREFDTPGENIDVEYEFCVNGSGGSNGKYRARGYGRVMDGGGWRKVDAFIIETRLERDDHVITSRRCDYTKAVNAGDTNANCASPYALGRDPHLTGDGRIYIDIEDDGRGGTWYDLAGSKPIGS
ncbi:hypothetical protein FCH28_04430 [Streptomyces piniterrae]|uniref:Uncharacterized protein n=1 Tax=Streptomyces piniterrae TaxID=2571125 RepID=A0A4U0P276_9ACTN|nr:hypothetical protein [Streptomyces piniterrae]TJZ56784.1 hypothetical protein FCH28_04430 [Streptomyces piniterrae]